MEKVTVPKLQGRQALAQLNQDFMESCIENLRLRGTDCCLAPLAADYICHWFQLMGSSHSGERVMSVPFAEQLVDRITNDYNKYMKPRTIVKIPTALIPGLPSLKQRRLSVSSSSDSEISGSQISPVAVYVPTTTYFPLLKLSDHDKNSSGTSSSSNSWISELVPKPEREIVPAQSLYKKIDWKPSLFKELAEEVMATPNGFLSNNGPIFPHFNPAVYSQRNLPPVSNGLPSVETAHNPVPASTLPREDEDERSEREAQAHEYVPVAERDHAYSTRCKIFHMPDKTKPYQLRGVGMLYIQQIEGGYHRLLVRADNSLGNILLNMKITSDIPLTYNEAKKQVLTVDPHVPCPISIVVRKDEGENLFNQLKKYQTSAPSS